jgi:hypothetical protein
VFVPDDGENPWTLTAALVVRGPNGAPVVGLESPTNHAVFVAGSGVPLSAVAAASSGAVVKVEFFAGATLLGTVWAPPYAMIWSNPTAGQHSLTASVTDSKGNSARSEAVDISVAVMAGRPHLIAGNQLDVFGEQTGAAVAVGSGAVYVAGQTTSRASAGL